MRVRLPAITSRVFLLAAGVATLFTIAIVWLWRASFPASATRSSEFLTDTAHRTPPWIYGRADARFKVMVYADLECPYCRDYFPVLRQWIDTHPFVHWQWHHLPLRGSEPAALHAARFAECAGEVGGNTAFWTAIAWSYEHPRGEGQVRATAALFPHLSPAIQGCMKSTRPDAVIEAQAATAASEGIAATPTLKLVHQKTGKTLLWRGPLDEDALLSAFDWLVAPSQAVAPGRE